MIGSGSALLALSFSLNEYLDLFMVAFGRALAYQGSPLESWCASIKDKDRFYSIKQKFSYPTQETQYMSVQECLPVLVAHRGLKLVDPYTGINCHSFAFDSFQPNRIEVLLRICPNEMAL